MSNSTKRKGDTTYVGTCLICRHARRAEIELCLANGTPITKLVAKYAPILKDSFYRHRKKHMAPELLSQLQAAGHRVSPTDLQELRRTESEGLL